MEPMEAGRDLDALIADKVMGLNHSCNRQPARLRPGVACWICDDKLKPYSSDIAAAWEVVEKLLTIKVGICVSRMPNDKAWQTGSHQLDGVDFMCSVDDYFEASTAPLAICLVALKTVHG